MCNNNTLKIYNSTDLWQIETSLPAIPTFSQNLDNLIGSGGIQLGSITELIGLPGSGKTQLCLQLCASVQINKFLGGLNAEALYIDTNMNFSIFRFKEVLYASLLKCNQLLNLPNEINMEKALKKLHYVNAFGLEKFSSFLHNLPHFLEKYTNIRLIVIDSIAFPFKEGVTARQRTSLLFQYMAQIQKLSVEKRIAKSQYGNKMEIQKVVLTNEMSTRLGLAEGSVVGALGDAWSHRCNVRLLLSEADDDTTMVALVNSNREPVGAARVQITSEGIRDVE